MANKLIDAADAPARLRAARAILDESQEVFADRFGVTARWIAELEAGAVTPSLKLAVAIETLTGIAPTDWMTSAQEAIA